ncbi:hypothetical protein CQW23_00084 [Capsicum baccatum]|uniref:Uncharacterized protein n=1 Tax=Capsicum baccatum TaxID=33114 RepID=A0A2G2XK48_CAPBA|nr:hypothetical protein CQW23_00084 [Capsicum baccatum]
MEEHYLKIENARLRDEYIRICLIAYKVLGLSLSFFNCPLPAGVGLDLGNGISSAATPVISPRPTPTLLISGPLSFRSLDGNGEGLNLEEYARSFPPCIGMKPANFTTEATKATSTVMINSLALVETLIDTSQWVD